MQTLPPRVARRCQEGIGHAGPPASSKRVWTRYVAHADRCGLRELLMTLLFHLFMEQKINN